MSASTAKDKRLLYMSYVLLFIYNGVFFTSRFATDFGLGSWGETFDSIDESYTLFTILEFFGVAAIFIDLLGNYDRKKLTTRRLQLFLCAIFILAFIFKLFIVYLDSSVG